MRNCLLFLETVTNRHSTVVISDTVRDAGNSINSLAGREALSLSAKGYFNWALFFPRLLVKLSIKTLCRV